MSEAVKTIEMNKVHDLLREVILNILNEDIERHDACLNASYIIEDFIVENKIPWEEPTQEEFEYYANPDDEDEEASEEETE